MNVLLCKSEIDVTAIGESVKGFEMGGVVTFTGDVRAVTGDLVTSKLVYEAHESMAIHQMTAIAKTAAERWNAHVAVAHRIGELHPGETAVVCVAACAHRAEAFECCQFLIDRIKEDVPIWKKEVGSDGQAWIAGDRRISVDPSQ